jgi:ABC-type branched-subunit amino acid transport system ATPase component
MSPDEPEPLRAENISVRFGGLLALDDVTVRVQPRGIVGLIGPNGAGKTTLFNCVTGVLRPTKGRVFLFGDDATDWAVHRRARLGVGRTFQRLELFSSLSVLENLIAGYEGASARGGLVSDLLALPPTVEQRADATDRAQYVMEVLGLDRFRDTPAGDLPIGLSRLVELGRAVCGDPRIMLLDEPSSGLSVEESERLAALLRVARDEDGESILLVEHDMPFVLGLADYIYVLDFGKPLAEGTPKEIRKNPAVQAAYLGEEVDEGVQRQEFQEAEVTEDATARRS